MSEFGWQMMILVVLPFTIGVLAIGVLERVPIGMTASQRSWLWRFLYTKTILILVIPSWALWSVPVPAWVSFEPTESPTLERVVPLNDAVRVTVVPKQPMEPGALQVAGQRVESVRGSSVNWLLGGLVVVWLAGAAGCAAIATIQFLKLTSRIRSSHVKPSSKLLETATQVSRQLGVRGLSRLVLSDAVQSPVILLSPRPWLVLPKDFEQRHGLEGCRMAIAHELAHYQRGDLWWNMVASLVSIGMFFWPPAWYAARRYYMSVEMAADQQAIASARLGRAAYASLLVRLLEGKGRRQAGAMVLAMAHSSSYYALKERVESMNISWQNLGWRRLLAGACTAVFGLLVFVPWSFGQDDTDRKRNRGTRNRSSMQPNSGASSSASNRYSSSPTQPQPSAQSVTAHASGSASGFAMGSAGGSGYGSSLSGGTAGDGSMGGMQLPGSGSMSMGSGSGSAMSGVAGSVSAGVSIGGKPSAASVSPGELSGRSQGYPQRNTVSGISSGGGTSDGVSVARSAETLDDETILRTRIDTATERIQIEESDIDGITVTIQPRKRVRGQAKRVFTAESAEALRDQHPEAYRWYERYAQDNLRIDRADAIPGGDGSNPATELLQKQLEQTMQQTDDPMLRNQLRNMLDQIRNR